MKAAPRSELESGAPTTAVVLEMATEAPNRAMFVVGLGASARSSVAAWNTNALPVVVWPGAPTTAFPLEIATAAPKFAEAASVVCGSSAVGADHIAPLRWYA